MLLERRDALLTALFGAGHVGLRALATGLPAWFIANPRLANAQNLDCAIMAKEKLQYLILSTSSPVRNPIEVTRSRRQLPQCNSSRLFARSPTPFRRPSGPSPGF